MIQERWWWYVQVVCSMQLENQILHNLPDCNFVNLFFFLTYRLNIDDRINRSNSRQLRNEGENICVLSTIDNDAPYLPIKAPPGISYSIDCPSLIRCLRNGAPTYREKSSVDRRLKFFLISILTIIFPSFAAIDAPNHWSVLLSNDVPTRTLASPVKKKDKDERWWRF